MTRLDCAALLETVSFSLRARDAGFDEARFRALARRHLEGLAANLGPGPASRACLEAWATLVGEALFEGLLGPRGTGVDRLAGRVFLELVPRDLPQVEASLRVPTLAEALNLVEGLGTQPPWLQAWLTSGLDQLRGLTSLGDDLVAILGEAQAPDPAGRPGLRLAQVLDLTAADPDFLPGAIHLAYERVACVHDRVRPEVHLAVGLRPGGQSRVLGPGPCRRAEGPKGRGPLDPRANVVFGEDRLEVEGAEVTLPRFGHFFSWLRCATGFLLSASESSQRLWIVEGA